MITMVQHSGLLVGSMNVCIAWEECLSTPIEELVDRVRRENVPHAVVYGRNIMNHYTRAAATRICSTVAELLSALKADFVDLDAKEGKGAWKHGLHTTLKLSLEDGFDEALFHHSDLVSIQLNPLENTERTDSNKLRPDTMEWLVRLRRWRAGGDGGKALQFLLKCETDVMILAAVKWAEMAYAWETKLGTPRAHYFLEPTSKLQAVMIRSVLTRWYRHQVTGYGYPHLRVIPC